MPLPIFYRRKFKRCPEHFLWLKPQAKGGRLCKDCGWRILVMPEYETHYVKMWDLRYGPEPERRKRYWEH